MFSHKLVQVPKRLIKEAVPATVCSEQASKPLNHTRLYELRFGKVVRATTCEPVDLPVVDCPDGRGVQSGVWLPGYLRKNMVTTVYFGKRQSGSIQINTRRPIRYLLTGKKKPQI